MKKLILSLVVVLSATFNANAQSDTTVISVSGSKVGAVVGNTYFANPKASKYTTNTIVEAGGYELYDGDIPSEIQSKFVKTKSVIFQDPANKDRGFYLKQAGTYKNIAMGVQGAGALLSTQQMSEGNYSNAATTTLISTIVSIGLNFAGNNALIKAGEVK